MQEICLLPGGQQEPEENDSMKSALVAQERGAVPSAFCRQSQLLCLRLSRACQDQCKDSH